MKKLMAVLLISTMCWATTPQPTYDKTASVVFEWGITGGIGDVRPGEQTYTVQNGLQSTDCAADESHIRCGQETAYTSMQLRLTDFHGKSGWFSFRPFLFGGGWLNKKDVTSKCPVIEDIEAALLQNKPPIILPPPSVALVIQRAEDTLKTRALTESELKELEAADDAMKATAPKRDNKVHVDFAYRYGNYDDDIFIPCAFDKVDANGHLTVKTGEAHYHLELVESVEKLLVVR